MAINNIYLESIKKQMLYYKTIAEKAMEQLSEEQLFVSVNEDTNSIANIVKHMSGNMISRWTDFLTSDGEKPWRERDTEFESFKTSKKDLLEIWDKGWKCFFNAINSLEPEQLSQIIYIRNEGQTALDAINRQLAHYPYHIGQIVFIGKMICNNHWKSLSIPKGNSKVYNQEKFSNVQSTQHFTDEFLKK